MERLPDITFKEPGSPNFKKIDDGHFIVQLPGYETLDIKGDFDDPDKTTSAIRFEGFTPDNKLVDEIQVEMEVVYKYKAPTIH